MGQCQKWHASLQNTLKNHPGFAYDESNPDHNYYAVLPKFWYSIDQITMPFVVGIDDTWAYEGTWPTNVAQPGSGLEKMMEIIQVIHQMGGEQPKNISSSSVAQGGGGGYETEKLAHHPSINVYFQKKACYDREFNIEWADTHLSEIYYKQQLDPETGGRYNLLLFSENLYGHKTDLYNQTFK